MKKIIVWIFLITVLLCSCYQDETFPPIGNHAYISMTNNSETVVYWQLRKADEENAIYNRLGIGGNIIIEASQGDSFVLSFAGLETDSVEIVGETLVFKQTTTEIHIENITLDDRQKVVFFNGDASEVVCTIH